MQLPRQRWCRVFRLPKWHLFFCAPVRGLSIQRNVCNGLLEWILSKRSHADLWKVPRFLCQVQRTFRFAKLYLVCSTARAHSLFAAAGFDCCLWSLLGILWGRLGLRWKFHLPSLPRNMFTLHQTAQRGKLHQVPSRTLTIYLRSCSRFADHWKMRQWLQPRLLPQSGWLNVLLYPFSPK